MTRVQSRIQILLLLVYMSFQLSCTPTSRTLTDAAREAALQKINFDTNKIDENGLIGPSDGKVLVAYKFRIPAENTKRREVKKIDPSVRFFKKPNDDLYSCIGEGATQNVLIKLASLPYIIKIDPFYGE